MAQNLGKKKGKGKGGGGQGGGGQPYDPTATFETQHEANQAIKQRAKSLYKPQIQDLKRQEKQSQLASTGRTSDIGSMYDYSDQQLQASYQAQRDALDKLVGLNATGGAQAQAGLSAALGASRGSELDLANMVGAAAPASTTPDAQLATFGSSQALNQALLGGAEAYLTQAGGRKDVNTLSRGRDLTAEMDRERAAEADIQGQIGDIRSNKPMYLEQARKAVTDEQLAAAAQKFQQHIAQGQLNLGKKQEHHQNQQAQTQAAQNQQQLDQQQQQFEDQLAADVASGGTSQGTADQAIGKFRVGRTQLEKWLGAQTSGKHATIRDSEIAQLFQNLKKSYKLPEDLIYKLLRGSGNPALLKWANNRDPHHAGIFNFGPIIQSLAEGLHLGN